MSTNQQNANEPQVILLIGPTGSGKSSFVKSLTKEKVEVNGIKTCTTECKLYRVEVETNGRPKVFIIIDTPGFEDLPEENLGALMKIATTLDRLRQPVFGAIYFHRITDGRLMGTTRAVLSIFKSICGERFYPHVAFITTMWDTIGHEKHYRYLKINTELEEKHMKLSKHSPGIFRRMNDDTDSSKAVLQHFARLAESVKTAPALLLIKELGGSKRVRKTTAGREILKRAGSGGPNFCVVL